MRDYILGYMYGYEEEHAVDVRCYGQDELYNGEDKSCTPKAHFLYIGKKLLMSK